VRVQSGKCSAVSATPFSDEKLGHANYVSFVASPWSLIDEPVRQRSVFAELRTPGVVSTQAELDLAAWEFFPPLLVLSKQAVSKNLNREVLR
jgi:hypothetical protein